MKTRTRIITCVALLSAAGVCITPALGDMFTISDLGSLYGWTFPRSIADSGDVAGVTVGPDWRDHGFAWSGTLDALQPLPPDTESQGMDLISADDVVAAAYSMGTINARAVRIQSGSPTELGAFTPSAMNTLGTVVGTRSVLGAFGVDVSEAVVWANGVLTPLPQLSGGENASAFDIADDGDIVGSGFVANGLKPRAVLWTGNAAFDLGTLTGGTTAQAKGISNTGFVCGVSATATAPMHAFRYHTVGATVTERLDLGTLGGGWSVAYGVNDAGWVVGTSDDRAFVWADGQMWDLNNAIDPASGWRLIGATAINNQFEIVGWGDHGVFGLRAFRFTFAPAPSCAGDITGDGFTNSSDFNVLAMHFGMMSGATHADGDLTGDGAVDSADFNVLAGDFGCGP